MAKSNQYTAAGLQQVFTIVLVGCTLLFFSRVAAQAIQWISPVTVLPPFEVWQSGLLPYPILLVSQMLILGLMTIVSFKANSNKLPHDERLGRVLAHFGRLYFSIMACRLVIGIFIAPNHFWFSQWLPTLFHLLLASFVMIVAQVLCQPKNFSLNTKVRFASQ